MFFTITILARETEIFQVIPSASAAWRFVFYVKPLMG